MSPCQRRRSCNVGLPFVTDEELNLMFSLSNSEKLQVPMRDPRHYYLQEAFSGKFRSSPAASLPRYTH
jgi:hypothetical protein